MAEQPKIARVLIDSPLPQLDRLFDYAIPESLSTSAVSGVRVSVPFRSAGRVSAGYIVEVVDSIEYSGTLSAIESVVSPLPVLREEVWRLARAAADRAAGSASDILRLAIPPRQVRVEKAWLDSAPAAPPSTVITPAVTGYPAGVVQSMIRSNGRAAVAAIPGVVECAPDATVGAWALTLAQAAAATIAEGRSAILAVPDYRDQEQLLASLAQLLPAERIIRLDARQPNADRYRAFLRCLGESGIVIVGNRSVIYAPAPALGLIALWDDGDPLHAEPLAPYVHSRDAALIRQEQQRCSLLFLANSRSTEVQRLVEVGWLTEIDPQPRRRPKVMPTAQQAAREGFAARARIPSSAWEIASAALKSGPVLIQVARPGYAPRLACRDCHSTARCRQCEGPLRVKAASAVPSCSWCGALSVNWRCTVCDGGTTRLVGSGATRTAEDLGRAFPGVLVLVADGERQLLQVGDEPALVIATRGAEPVAKGGYAAVLLLDGEGMLARESLRVGEDCLRAWSNAAALASPAASIVLVGVGGA
ncbi:MAG: primosomal protein N', partial [Salinibacterium sp.]|nr:primosomal protein N' [Salinibacterium sp.]